MSVTVFYASVSGSLEVKKHQERIISVLTSKKIPFKLVDITETPDYKNTMRKMANNPAALPPQIANGGIYCGDFNAFEHAVEMEKLPQFLKM